MSQRYQNMTSAFTLLRFPLILGVILIHCDISGDISAGDAEGFMCFLGWWDRSILKVCVPLFFAISGFLFFRDGCPTARAYGQKFRRRLKSLVIPYLIWNTMALLLLAIKALPPLSAYFPQYAGRDFSLTVVVDGYLSIVEYPFDYVLWFLRDLIICVAFTPLIAVIIKKTRGMVVPLLFVLLIFWNIYAAQSMSDIQSMLKSVLWFAVGAAVPLAGLPEAAMLAVMRRILVPVYVLCCLLQLCFPVIQDEGAAAVILYYVTILSGIASFICLAIRFCRMGLGVPPGLTASTFFVYACHGLYCTVVRHIVVYMVPPAHTPTAFADYLFIFAADLFVALALYKVILKFWPAAMPWLGAKTPPAAFTQ